jgi:hypothetical protein
MGFRWGPSSVIIVLLVLSCGGAEGAGLTVDTQVPEYILEDHIDLAGTINGTLQSLVEDDYEDFEGGERSNVVLDEDGLVLMPTLDFQIQNGGRPVLEPGTGDDWDTMILDSYSVEHEGMYYLFYTGMRSGSLAAPRHIGVATSTDGVAWTKYRDNPVLMSRVDSYDYTNLFQPNVIVVEGVFHMLYGGNHGNRISSEMQDVDVCYATSDDGFAWIKHASNPVIKNGPIDTDWDGLAIRPGDIHLDGETFKFYVKGVGYTRGAGAKPQLGLFTSTDLVSWTEHEGNPLYKGDPNGWERERTNYNSIDTYDNTYRLWTHTDSTLQIGWMASQDGLEWEDSGQAMLVPAPGTIYSTGLRHPRSVTDGDKYLMWVMCSSSYVYTVGHFKVSPEGLDGRYTSSAMDAGRVVSVLDVSWDETLWNGSSISYTLRWSNDTTWSSWREVTEADQPTGVSARYFQYRADFLSAKHWMRPRLDRFQINLTAMAGTVDISVDGRPWQSATVDDEGGWNATVPLHDGDYVVRVRALDAAGGEVVVPVPVKVDLHPPQGVLQLEYGRNVTSINAIDWDVMASDTHGVPFIRVSTDPEMEDLEWVPFTAAGVLYYDGPDGFVTVHMELRDGAGRTSLINDSIWVDTTPPTGNLTINDGAGITKNRTVDLDIEWEDATGVVGMYVSNYPSFTNSVYTEPVNEMEWDLLDLDGVRTVFVKLVDMAGHEAVLWSSIILDRVPPYAAFVIDGNREFTRDREVTLDIFELEDLPVVARFVNGQVPFGGEWMEIEDGQHLPWTLSEGPDGERTVRMLVRDQAGHEEIVVDTIILDSTPPEGALEFPECPDGFTSSPRVLVRIAAWDEISGIQKWRSHIEGEWYPFQPFINVTLPSEEGMWEIAVDLLDGAGNEAVLIASIMLDMTAPEGHIILANGSEFVNYLSIPVSLYFEDEGSGLSAFTNPILLDGDDPWTNYTDATSFIIPDDQSVEEREGPWDITYFVRDRAGNVGSASATVILDQTGPVIELQHVGGRWEAGMNEFTVIVWDEFDPSPRAEWRVDGRGWKVIEGNGFQVDLDTGVHKIEVRAVDAAGNEAKGSLEEDVALDLFVISAWILLALVIFSVMVFVVWREHKRTKEKMMNR